jgi:predicted Zn-dependent peptidase
MRIRFALLALALLAAPSWAQQVQPEEVVLDNGMKFLLLPRAAQPNSVSCGWVAKVGSVNERPGITGISHFFEHMMFKGTKTIGTSDAAKDAELNQAQHAARGRLRALVLEKQYPRWRAGELDDPWDPKNDTDEMKKIRTELTELVDQQRKVTVKDEFDSVYTGLGASGMNAFTSQDLTFYFISVPSNKLELWTWMESDRLSDHVFREFYSERDVVHEERRLRTESTPTGIFEEQFEAMFWQSSPYSWPVIGWPTDLNSYTAEQAEDYFKTWYRPNNLVGVIVGDFDKAAAKSLIKRYFGRLPKGEPTPPVVTLEQPQKGEQRMAAECDAAPQVEVRYHSVPFGHPDEAPIEVLAELMNGQTGRLYKALIEGKQVATGASVRQDSRKYGGAFAFTGECKGDATPQLVEEAWYEELRRLQEEEIPERELQKVKNRVLADSFRRLESNFFLMMQLGYYEALGGWQYINDSPKALLAVKAEDVKRVAKKYFDVTNRSVATFTRKAGSEAPAADAEIEALPAQLRAMAKQALSELAAADDPEQLQAELGQLEAQAGAVPPEVKPLLELILKRAKQRLAELQKAAEKEGK